MHEMGIVQSIMTIIEDQARINNAEKILKINLEFGALTGVLPTAVSFAFEVLSKGSIAEGAQLEVTIIPVKIKCLECGEEIVLENYNPFCPLCSSPAVKIVQGRDEMRIASIEIN